jgi:hypothetical protein
MQGKIFLCIKIVEGHRKYVKVDVPIIDSMNYEVEVFL